MEMIPGFFYIKTPAIRN